ncbi:ABC transporter ATP-binding protein [Chitinasiproducens palmae]|uniref:Peptide/nickel transport system ATP-binding protein n=1 Tax=Chitinasiproducens palmae TaxID=1770053 RepID=A0A1H2PUE0_9BURK|nr:ABC transporter ATP-binding protein [Chitinasiproducens palmae]SDV50797.1 peptide/nickel transport system ATP-binding protein [Chitinasiproducens palmae]
MNPALVYARDLRVSFVSPERTVDVVRGVDVDLQAGETLCLLGESGSGKSVMLRALMGLNPAATTRLSGTLQVAGRDALADGGRALRAMRGGTVSMIFQEPMTALDPVFTVGDQIAETIVRHEGVNWKTARARALSLIERVQVPSARRRMQAYPHELSGGLRQRMMIAMALSCRPKLLLADEPTTALDASVQIQILTLLRELQAEMGMGVIFVTHDLEVAAEIADRVMVMYAGRMVERGLVDDIMDEPLHPYTQGLMAATVLPGSAGARLETIPGAPPRPERPPPGCAFSPRCSRVVPACSLEVPAFARGATHDARCIRIDERAPRAR